MYHVYSSTLYSVTFTTWHPSARTRGRWHVIMRAAHGDSACSPTCMSSECCDQRAVVLLQFEDGYLA